MKLWKWIRSFFPSRLPVGMTEFNQWLEDIIELSGLPNNITTRRASALFIFSIPQNVCRMRKREVVNQLLKAASNQVAAAVKKECDEEEQAKDASGTSSFLVQKATARN